MKKLLYFICVLVIASFSAQRLYAQDFKVGVKAGVGFTSVNHSVDEGEAPDSDGKIGFQGGAFVELDWGLISLQPELFYSLQGETYPEVKVLGVTVPEQTLNLGYLQIPILVRFETEFGLAGFIGPQVGFLLTKSGTVGDDDIDDDAFKNYESLDVAAVIGAAYDFEFGLGIDVRYNYGFLDNEGLPEGVSGDDPLTSTNQAIQLSLSYAIYDSTR